MDTILDFLRSLHSADGLRHLVQTGGLVALVGIVFAETGLLAGFFLPGDSLLVTAGIFAAGDGAGGPPLFSLSVLIGVLCVAAVVGDQLGYILGAKTGDLILQRPDGMFFKKKHLTAAHEFYEKHGSKAIVLARFVPILRTFVPFAAGMAKMSYSGFVRFNVIGGILWVSSMILLGYFVGMTPLGQQLHRVILVVIFVSVLPLFISVGKAWMRLRAQKAALKAK
jgi:membrane-associated protein